MHKKLSFASVAVAALFILAGCNSGPSLVGKWESSIPQMPAGKMVTEFKGDGTTASVMNMDVMGQKITITGNGTYKLEKDALTMKGVDYKVEGIPEQMLANGKAQMDKEFKKESKTKIEWISPDEITLTMDKGQPLTMKRVKS